MGARRNREPAGDRRLIGALKDAEWKVRAKAAWAIGEIADQRAAEAFSASLKDEHPEVQEDGRLGARRSDRPLIRIQKGDCPMARNPCHWGRPQEGGDVTKNLRFVGVAIVAAVASGSVAVGRAAVADADPNAHTDADAEADAGHQRQRRRGRRRGRPRDAAAGGDRSADRRLEGFRCRRPPARAVGADARPRHGPRRVPDDAGQGPERRRATAGDAPAGTLARSEGEPDSWRRR